jgi:CRISPR-associated endonuclease Csn1
MIKKNHGDEWKFLMALHINDTVSIEKENGDRVFYRVQKLDVSGGLTLRLNTASTIDNKKEEIRISISSLFKEDIAKHKVNAIGGLMDD